VRLDRDGQITPRGYSRTLGIMIACFIGGFVAALAVSVAVGPGV
jgi:hypothetical protein